jgi:DNA-binding transcriptional ArsR family regulator
MDTILGSIVVPGWTQVRAEHPTRALTLQALTNLELAFYQAHQAQRPTRKQILAEVIRLGGAISDASVQTIQRHLDELAQTGHVTKRARGKSPWYSRYLLLPAPIKEK